MQPAYRNPHCTETALLKVTNDILLSLNRQHVSLLVLLDLISAFDTVDQSILLNLPQSHFGICDSSLSWFESYLSGRTQFVSIKGTHSTNVSIQHRVPQAWSASLYIQSTPLNKATSVRGHFAPIKRRTLLTENILY